MSVLNAKELRDLSAPELEEKLVELRKELYTMRSDRRQGQSQQPHRFAQVRRGISRLLTIQSQKQRTS